jgi:hypothetical protein
MYNRYTFSLLSSHLATKRATTIGILRFKQEGGSLLVAQERGLVRAEGQTNQRHSLFDTRTNDALS